MTFLGTRKRHLIFWALVLICVLGTKISTFSGLRLSLDSIFSGLLALTGFVFTARTFITFKLNEVIYGTAEYRQYVERLRSEGAYTREVYDPLRKIDESLGTATYMCLWATILFIIVAFLPKPETIALGSKDTVDYVWELHRLVTPGDFGMIKKASMVVFCKAFTDAAMVYFGYCLYQMVMTSRSLHQNISAIVTHWEKEYKEKKAAAPTVNPPAEGQEDRTNSP